MANKKCCRDKEICEHFKLFVLKLERDHKQASDWLDAFAEFGRVSSVRQEVRQTGYQEPGGIRDCVLSATYGLSTLGGRKRLRGRAQKLSKLGLFYGRYDGWLFSAAVDR
ncbi:hypothetical protein DTO280E4_8356 [Paecilomyces variotii]|nr:hypothetical protein DTO169E5_5316 [Paecilomyces variotii]KAJ9261117.1 hypothetical protein DTO207G8_267 [Paecilomyces variotii]KAJ9351021.1 hypothetical protein DTO027B9_6606 [Paecilomyces variotii]KAJ9351210.1 hypothetical protein DTO280E4_8356 [Paecilomyces variotii]KAJ9393013.1 hypothetical protein DTO063F5_150 [Paecilomyces variotii]